MNRFWWTVVMLLLAAISLLANKALAEDHPHNKWDGHHHQWQHQRDVRTHHGSPQRDWRHEHHRNHIEQAKHHRRHRPHHDRDYRAQGWQNGNKTGWNGANVPPGQAKKGL